MRSRFRRALTTLRSLSDLVIGSDRSGKLSVRDLEVKEGRVFVRVEFNVPTEQIDGNIRIRVTALTDR